MKSPSSALGVVRAIQRRMRHHYWMGQLVWSAESESLYLARCDADRAYYSALSEQTRIRRLRRNRRLVRHFRALYAAEFEA